MPKRILISTRMAIPNQISISSSLVWLIPSPIVSSFHQLFESRGFFSKNIANHLDQFEWSMRFLSILLHEKIDIPRKMWSHVVIQSTFTTLGWFERDTFHTGLCQPERIAISNLNHIKIWFQQSSVTYKGSNNLNDLIQKFKGTAKNMLCKKENQVLSNLASTRHHWN